MEYVLDSLSGSVENRKDSLKQYMELCKTSFPSRKRGPADAVSSLQVTGNGGSMLQVEKYPVQTMARVVTIQQQGFRENAQFHDKMWTAVSSLVAQNNALQTQAMNDLVDSRVQLGICKEKAEQLAVVSADRDRLAREKFELTCKYEDLEIRYRAKEDLLYADETFQSEQLKHAIEERDLLSQKNAEITAELEETKKRKLEISEELETQTKRKLEISKELETQIERNANHCTVNGRQERFIAKLERKISTLEHKLKLAENGYSDAASHASSDGSY
jgi:hypothetical protein